MKGIDISHNNTVKDWNAVKANVDFVMIRSGYGRTDDRKFAEYMKDASAVGLPIGIWYFSYALNEAEAVLEAEHCVKLIKPYGVKFPVFFDFEYASEDYAAKKKVKCTVASRTAIHKAFCERIKALGYPVGIYTNIDYITSRLNWDELRGYNLWLAEWPCGEKTVVKYEQFSPASVNTKYGIPVIWQFGLGSVGGINGNVDVDFGYIDFPKIAADKPKPVVAPLKPGDKVAVLNTFISGGKKKARVYNSLLAFTVYYDSYDVMGVSGKRIAIGKNGVVAAAVNVDNLKKI